MDLRNAGILPQHYTASEPRRPRFETTAVKTSNLTSVKLIDIVLVDLRASKDQIFALFGIFYLCIPMCSKVYVGQARLK